MDIQQLRQELAPYFVSYSSSRFLGRFTTNPLTADVPGGLQSGDWGIRTDLGWFCYYDGTRWLTMEDYQAQFQAIVGNTATGNLAATIQSIPYLFIPYVVQYDIYVDTGATNNGSNYWFFDLAAAGVTALNRVSTATLAASASAQHCVATNSISNTLTHYPFMCVAAGKIGSPSAINLYGIARYRYVVT